MGIVIVELLISGASSNDPDLISALLARGLLDSEGTDGISLAVQAKAAECVWWQGKGKQAAKILADVAASLVGATGVRKTPAQVLGELERAHKLVANDSGWGLFADSGWSGNLWGTSAPRN
jgi:hypothetical protein